MYTKLFHELKQSPEKREFIRQILQSSKTTWDHSSDWNTNLMESRMVYLSTNKSNFHSWRFES